MLSFSIACDSSCLTGDEGLGYCTGAAAEACCNVYQPNEMGVNICAVSCSDGYEADPPDFICGELHAIHVSVFSSYSTFLSVSLFEFSACMSVHMSIFKFSQRDVVLC